MGKLTVVLKNGEQLTATCASHKEAMQLLTLRFHEVQDFRYDTNTTVIASKMLWPKSATEREYILPVES